MTKENEKKEIWYVEARGTTTFKLLFTEPVDYEEAILGWSSEFYEDELDMETGELEITDAE